MCLLHCGIVCSLPFTTNKCGYLIIDNIKADFMYL